MKALRRAVQFAGRVIVAVLGTGAPATRETALREHPRLAYGY